MLLPVDLTQLVRGFINLIRHSERLADARYGRKYCRSETRRTSLGRQRHLPLVTDAPDSRRLALITLCCSGPARLAGARSCVASDGRTCKELDAIADLGQPVITCVIKSGGRMGHPRRMDPFMDALSSLSCTHNKP